LGGNIRAAGLDVYDGEPKVNSGYLMLENVTLLPHLGSANGHAVAAPPSNVMNSRRLQSITSSARPSNVTGR
jgi:lactate dehydrogenase-like 2-hydroxyacid dehydrogenase